MKGFSYPGKAPISPIKHGDNKPDAGSLFERMGGWFSKKDLDKTNKIKTSKEELVDDEGVHSQASEGVANNVVKKEVFGGTGKEWIMGKGKGLEEKNTI